MKNKNEEKVIEYESELAKSFDFVLREAEELYQGHGRLKETYERLNK